MRSGRVEQTGGTAPVPFRNTRRNASAERTVSPLPAVERNRPSRCSTSSNRRQWNGSGTLKKTLSKRNIASEVRKNGGSISDKRAGLLAVTLAKPQKREPVGV
ncbi:hypothetical protein GCM10020000_86720 [Streptomyces olivoverticillatus]